MHIYIVLEWESITMSEMQHEPSADDLIARHFAGRFVRRDEGMWFDRRTAQEVLEFCTTHRIAVVRIDEAWDWPHEGRQLAIMDNRTVLQRSLSWQEVLETCYWRARTLVADHLKGEAGFEVAFTYYTEDTWQDHYA
jgi:hypothetical protein